MLVLHRRKFEKIIVRVPGHEPIVIVVIETQRNRTSLGIMASEKIKIIRAELEGEEE